MTSYTITRALSRIKALKSKLNKASGDTYIDTISTVRLDSEEGVRIQKTLIANAQSVADITNEIIRLKLAVEQSNLTTLVTIENKTMSVREAVELKRLFEDYLSDIADEMTRQLRLAKTKEMQLNQDIERAQEETINVLSALGAELSQAQIDERVKASLATVRLTKEMSILSFDKTLEAEQAVDNYYKHIQGFLEEIDYVLSESNAVTTVQI